MLQLFRLASPLGVSILASTWFSECYLLDLTPAENIVRA